MVNVYFGEENEFKSWFHNHWKLWDIVIIIHHSRPSYHNTNTRRLVALFLYQEYEDMGWTFVFGRCEDDYFVLHFKINGVVWLDMILKKTLNC
jgi:hypothetical protein